MKHIIIVSFCFFSFSLSFGQTTKTQKNKNLLTKFNSEQGNKKVIDKYFGKGLESLTSKDGAKAVSADSLRLINKKTIRKPKSK